MIIHDRMPALRKALKGMTANRVLVGVPAEKGLRLDPDEPGDPVNNAMIAYWMENGVPESNIPARPSIGPGIESVRAQINVRFEVCARNVLEGRGADVGSTLNVVGLIAQNAIRAKITDGPFIPLRPATLAARRRGGRTGEKPLIDTGQFRASISYVIRPANALSGR